MGQIFHSCAYDIETMTCCVYDADKFHANCYAFSGSVLSIHYLLRQKPYNVMWGGAYIVLDNELENISREQDLLGLSTYLDYEDFKMNDEKVKEKSYYEKIKFIDKNHKLWEKIDVWDKSKDYFDWDKTHSVKYIGYLLNHTQKLAINLSDYYEQSRGINDNKINYTIDLIPMLTETGGGAIMALSDGSSAETTEELMGTWCGDLLQIVEKVPKEYKIINCCFASIWKRVMYCYDNFGVDKDGCVKKNAEERFQGVSYNIAQKRSSAVYITAEETDKGVRFSGKYEK